MSLAADMFGTPFPVGGVTHTPGGAATLICHSEKTIQLFLGGACEVMSIGTWDTLCVCSLVPLMQLLHDFHFHTAAHARVKSQSVVCLMLPRQNNTKLP